jgi:chemosensory pili system protein ChpC
MAETSEQLSCVLIPVRDQTLLLPNVAIAEIVDYDLETDNSERRWFLGRIQWRGVSLPVLSWEAANGGEPAIPEGRRGRILVLNTITTKHKSMPFIALAAQGIPTQAKVAPSDLKKKTEGDLGVAGLMKVQFEGEECLIPDLSVLESLAASVTG